MNGTYGPDSVPIEFEIRPDRAVIMPDPTAPYIDALTTVLIIAGLITAVIKLAGRIFR